MKVESRAFKGAAFLFCMFLPSVDFETFIPFVKLEKYIKLKCE